MLSCDQPSPGLHANLCRCAPKLGRRLFVGGVAAALAAPAVRAQTSEDPFRIDVHHHYTSPALLAMMRGRRTRQSFNEAWTVGGSLGAMDQGGVKTAVVSTSDPGVFFGDYDAARALSRDCNEFQAKLMADHPGRFGMFVTVPLPDIDNALAEIAYGLDTLHAHGVGLMTSYVGKYLGDPAFAPVMDELNRRKAVVFVHPLSSACCTNVLPGVADQLIEYNTDTSRTVASLIFSGTTARCPDIRFIFSHGGGTVPYLVARFQRIFSGRADLVKLMPEGVVAQIQRLYFDTAQAFNVYDMAAMTKLMPDGHIVYGSDYPAADPVDTSKGLATLGLAPALERAIGRDNALALMPGLARA
jgi:predicted TIM-barrel fold metal-dependent hydrolase